MLKFWNGSLLFLFRILTFGFFGESKKKLKHHIFYNRQRNVIYKEFNVSLYIFRIPFLFSVFKLLKSLILCLSLRARTPGAESFLSTRSLYIPLEFFFLFKDLKLSFDGGWFCCLILLKSNEYRFHILCMPYKVN